MIPFTFFYLMGILGGGFTALISLLIDDSDRKSRSNPNYFRSTELGKKNSYEFDNSIPIFPCFSSNETDEEPSGWNKLNFDEEEINHKSFEPFLDFEYERVTILEHYPTGEVKVRSYLKSSNEY